MKSINQVIVKLLTCLSCLLVFSFSRAQRGTLKTTVDVVSASKARSIAGSGESTVGNTILLDVLFATNDDCDLYINEQLKGPVLKNEFRYVKLSPGKYSFTAKSKKTQDEMRDSFAVVEGSPNEVFMDLLYFVDEKAAEKERLAKVRTSTLPPATETIKKPVVKPPLVVNPITNKDAEQSVIYSLVANLVPVKGGGFLMGNNKSPLVDEAEHSVTIAPFLFSKYEVTQHQWEVIMSNNPSINIDCRTCPVENVSWEDAMKFIRKLNVISKKKFRLPTEAEWEYVAKMGGKGEVDTAGGQEAYIRKTAWYFSNSDKETHPVGSRQPNVLNIFDLTGNVSEWCIDWYGNRYYKEEYSQLNPEGPPLGKEKVIRGGNYKDYVGDRFRPSLRNKRNPIEKSGEVGFRLVMDVVE